MKANTLVKVTLVPIWILLRFCSAAFVTTIIFPALFHRTYPQNYSEGEVDTSRSIHLTVSVTLFRDKPDVSRMKKGLLRSHHSVSVCEIGTCITWEGCGEKRTNDFQSMRWYNINHAWRMHLDSTSNSNNRIYSHDSNLILLWERILNGKKFLMRFRALVHYSFFNKTWTTKNWLR